MIEPGSGFRAFAVALFAAFDEIAKALNAVVVILGALLVEAGRLLWHGAGKLGAAICGDTMPPYRSRISLRSDPSGLTFTITMGSRQEPARMDMPSWVEKDAPWT